MNPTPAKAATASKKPALLAMSCTSSDCENGLHCFRKAKGSKANPAKPEGTCRACGVDLIDWPRVQTRDLTDVDHTFEQLRHEMIRHHFWHVTIDEKAMNHARRKGRTALYEAAAKRVESSVRKSKQDNAWDGQQTPFTGSTLFYAQHAVAACCRTCIEYWHGIPSDRTLDEEEMEYLTELVIRYLEERLPMLGDEPEKVSPVKRS